VSDYGATKDRENMELILDYEIQGSAFYPLFNLLKICGFENWIGRWFGHKVNRKYTRYLQRGSVIEHIIEERGPYGGFVEP
jgi:hypothetical protein